MGYLDAFGNYFTPILLGAPEVVYPRINNIYIVILPFSYILIILSVTGEFNNGTSWTCALAIYLDMSPSQLEQLRLLDRIDISDARRNG